MAWMLKVPDNSPEWLLNHAKFCFKFSDTDRRSVEIQGLVVYSVIE